MESERDNTTDDQLLTVQEIAGLLKFPCPGIWAPSQTLHRRLPPTDSANTGALGPGGLGLDRKASQRLAGDLTWRLHSR